MKRTVSFPCVVYCDVTIDVEEDDTPPQIIEKAVVHAGLFELPKDGHLFGTALQTKSDKARLVLAGNNPMVLGAWIGGCEVL